MSVHLPSNLEAYRPACGAIVGTTEIMPERITCPDCLAILRKRVEDSKTPLTLGKHWAADKEVHFIRMVNWGAKNSKPYRCGAYTGAGSTLPRDVTCSDCLELIEGVGVPTPLHTPPTMNEDDGIFWFHDVHETDNWMLEVVPQTTGNVEITIGDKLFTLSHLDRADLLRALLHDFHYSPERGGPHDDTSI